jgi:hypothetical protein
VTTIFDSARRVKSVRKAFGLGVGRPGRAERPAPYSAADLSWWAENAPGNATGYEVDGPSDVMIEQAAGAALAQARMDHGFPPF